MSDSSTSPEPELWEIVLLVVFGAFLLQAAMLVGFGLLTSLDVQLDGSRTGNVTNMSVPKIYVAAFLEEVMFRFPLYLVVLGSSRLVLPAAIATSILFGYVHGNWTNILVQGSGGLVLSFIFLTAAGGPYKKPVRGIVASTTAHFLSNMLAYLAIITG